MAGNGQTAIARRDMPIGLVLAAAAVPAIDANALWTAGHQDPTVPKADEYSSVNVFARWGFDPWTMEFEGCAKSTSTWAIALEVADLRAAMPAIGTSPEDAYLLEFPSLPKTTT